MHSILFAALSNEPDAEIFAVQDQSHVNDKRWISDISLVFKNEFNSWAFVDTYCKANPEIDPNTLSSAITALKEIGNRRIGVIELTENLDIDIVTDIFIRINSQGTALSQGDFVMSKIAADTDHGGKNLRKLIDYFAHLSKVPAFHPVLLETDKEFANSEYMRKLDWLQHEIESVYDPDCDDVIRVAFMLQYYRSKLSELVLLLSGRDFKNREYKEEIVQQSFSNLEKGVLEVVNENNFKQFMLTIRGAGFVSPKLANSNMALDFAYMLFLRLLNSDCNHNEAKRIVQKWYVLSVLTGRYSASPESAFGRDLKRISEVGIPSALAEFESTTLSDTFWQATIPDRLRYNVTNSPVYQVYLAAQIAAGDVSLLSANVKVEDLLTIQGDVHHIFPKKYLIEHGRQKNQYNQNANFALLDTDVNKSIGKKSPKDYFALAFKQCETGVAECGTIMDRIQLLDNLRTNCIPEAIVDWDVDNYETFLAERRLLMAQKIKNYYNHL